MSINTYLEHLKDDYVSWAKPYRLDAEIIQRNREKIEIRESVRYYEVLVHGVIHSYVLKQDDSKFASGSILKPTEKGVNRYKSHGNINDDFIHISWNKFI